MLTVIIIIFSVAVGIKNGQGSHVQKSLAVLKFEYIASDSTESFLAHAVADEIINNLSNLTSLQVISASSSFKVDKKDNIKKIGRTLGVNYVVDGSLWRNKNQLKTTVKLIDVRTGYQLWSETFEEQFEDFFDMQEHIADKVAQELQISLDDGINPSANQKRTTSFKAYQLYIRAMKLGEMRFGEPIDEAISLLEKAVELDPNFAEAHAELSFLYGQKHYYASLDIEERNKKMKSSIEQALALDPESAEVLFAVADFDYRTGGMERDSSKVVSNFKKVFELRPNNARYSYRLFQVFRDINQHDVAHEYLEKTLKLDPLNHFYKIILARDYFWKKNNREKGLSLLEEVLAEDPQRDGAIYFKALMLADGPNGDLYSSFKILYNALQQQPYRYGFLYWGSLISSDIDLLPLAKKYTQLIQIKFPDNPIYTYGPALNICLMEKRYDDALDLTKIWAEDKRLDQDVAFSKIARINYLKGDVIKAKKLLLNQFADLFEKVENGQLKVTELQPIDIPPIRTYIEILRKEGKQGQALIYADFLCANLRAQSYRQSPLRLKFVNIECHYLQNDLEGFLEEVDKSFFDTKNRLALFSSLKSSNYKAFEANIEYQKLYERIEQETHEIRSKVIAFLTDQGDWNTSRSDELNLSVQ